MIAELGSIGGFGVTGIFRLLGASEMHAVIAIGGRVGRFAILEIIEIPRISGMVGILDIHEILQIFERTEVVHINRRIEIPEQRILRLQSKLLKLSRFSG